MWLCAFIACLAQTPAAKDVSGLAPEEAKLFRKLIEVYLLV